MSSKEAYQQKMQAELDQLKARIDLMRAKAAEAGADTRIELEKTLSGLDDRREKMEGRLDALKDAGEDAWDDVKKGVADAWDELGQAVDDASSRFRG